jgi:hypothetical protein
MSTHYTFRIGPWTLDRIILNLIAFLVIRFRYFKNEWLFFNRDYSEPI